MKPLISTAILNAAGLEAWHVCWLKRRITRGGISVLISPPREAISLRGQRRGLPIIQGQGGGNGEG